MHLLLTLNLAPLFSLTVPMRGATIGVVDVAVAEVVTEIGLLVVAEVATAIVTAIEEEEVATSLTMSSLTRTREGTATCSSSAASVSFLRCSSSRRS